MLMTWQRWLSKGSVTIVYERWRIIHIESFTLRHLCFSHLNDGSYSFCKKSWGRTVENVQMIKMFTPTHFILLQNKVNDDKDDSPLTDIQCMSMTVANMYNGS